MDVKIEVKKAKEASYEKLGRKKKVDNFTEKKKLCYETLKQLKQGK